MRTTQAVDDRGSEPGVARRHRIGTATLIAGVIAIATTLAPTSANAVIANSALAPTGPSTFDLSCTGKDPATSAALASVGLNPFTMATAISTNATDSPSDLESFTLDVTWQFTLPVSFVANAQGLGFTTWTQSNSTLSMTATSGATGASAPTDPGPTVINLPGDPAVDVPFQTNPVQVTFTRSGTGPVVLAPVSATTTLTDTAGISLNLLCTPTGNVTPLTLMDQAAPTIGTAVSGDGQATVSWTAPPSDGGPPIAGYVVAAYTDLAPVKVRFFNSTLTTQTITGLTNGTQYRFRVSAYNAIGNGPYSRASNPVTPAGPTPPSPPSIGTAASGDGQATVSWTAPLSDGGSPITGYVVTPYVGYWTGTPRTFASTDTTQLITGLTNGWPYRFRVQAVNSMGTGGYSKVSNLVTPGP